MKNVHTLGFEFCMYNSFKNCQPLTPCSFSSHKIARYVSHSVMLCLISSSDIPTQTQGVISICWDTMAKSEIAKDVKWIQHSHPLIPFFVCFLLNIVSPSQISTPKARDIFTTCWTEHPLTAIRSPCVMQCVFKVNRRNYRCVEINFIV